ncbi:MAG: GGDEF domain-containing protein [Synergistaceae bacterium]|nr:GGDEF domain-containing protein [Synergistaceae bacterium]
MSVWSSVLDSCPGLLCCVINLKGRLIYATHGYRAIAARLFGHKCEEGRNYPPLISDVDRDIHEALTAACLGESNAIEIDENGSIWELSASPLILPEDGDSKISGVVVRIVAASSKPQPPAPVVMSNPDILEAVPFRACITDDKGVILAANKYLCAGLGRNPSGSNIAEFAELDAVSGLMRIILRRSGSAECIMQDISEHDTFYAFTPEEIYLDAALNDIPQAEKTQARRMRIHASPIDWNGEKSSLLTFEDITDAKKTHDQLRRLLTFDTRAGILNRRGLEHVLLREIGECVKNGGDLSLIALSIDSLNYTAETSGYVAAERMVREFVGNMKKFLIGRADSVAARFGRDEFMAVVHCPGAVAVVMANEIRARAGNIPVSAGVADFYHGGYSGVSELIGAAYDTMNRAKADGGNITLLAGR